MLAYLALALAPVMGGCPTVEITPTLRRSEVARIDAAAQTHILPASVEYILADGPWRLIWATPQEAERGVFFFRRTAAGRWRLVDTWGGVLIPSERADGVA